MSENTLQKALMRYIKREISHIKPVEAIMEAFGISKSTAYLRLEGKKTISLDEAYTLCKFLNIDLRTLFPTKNNEVIVSIESIDKPFKGIKDYPNHLLKMLNYIDQLPGAQGTYLSNEIPVPYFFSSPLLTSFKMYVWARNTFKQEHLHNAQFQPNLIWREEGVKELAKNIIELYTRLERKEIWTSNILNRTFSQIRYCKKVSLFQNKEIINEILDELKRILKRFLKERNSGNEIRELYYQPYFSAEDIMLIDSPVDKRIIATFFSPDYFTSTNKRLITSSREKLKDIISSSEHLINEENKISLYGKLEVRIEEFRKEIFF